MCVGVCMCVCVCVCMCMPRCYHTDHFQASKVFYWTPCGLYSVFFHLAKFEKHFLMVLVRFFASTDMYNQKLTGHAKSSEVYSYVNHKRAL